MRFALLIVILALLVGCDPAPPPETGTAGPKVNKQAPRTIAGLSRYGLGMPVSYSNVTVIPVVLSEKEQMRSGDYLSLADAKKAGLVEISELPSGQEVNRLLVTNLGKKPLLLLAGELLLGGKQ